MKAIGIDIGTTTICGIVIDGESGAVLESRTLPNDTALPAVHPYERLQDADRIIRKAEKLTDEFLAAHSGVEGIGLSGQMHGILYTDKNGMAASPLYTWQDGRGNLPSASRDGRDKQDEASSPGLTAAQRLSRLTGYPMASGYGLTTHFSLSENHQAPENAVSFCTIGDYAAMRLTGRKTPVLTSSNAAGTGLFDLERLCYDRRALSLAGLEDTLLPEVSDDFQPAGFTRNGIPVAAAVGDNQASVLGSVADIRDTVLVNVGTGSQLSAGADGYLPDSPVEIRPFTGRDYIFAGASLCGGRSYALLERFFRESAAMVTGAPVPGDAYGAMEKRLKHFFPAGDLLRVGTQFCGTRKDPSLRGSIEGLSTENFTPEHFILGVLTGMVTELRDIYDLLLPCRENPPVRLVGSGNGIRKNKYLRALFEEAFGMKLRIPVHEEEASYGAALYSLVCAGRFRDVRQAQRLIRYRQEQD